MRKKLVFVKYILAFLIIAGSILYVVPYFLSLEGYRTQIATTIKDTTGQNAVIRGNITAHLLPLPEVRVSDIYMSDPHFSGEGENPVVSIKMLKARLKIIPLLTGKVEVKSLKLVNPIATWENIRSIRDSWKSPEAGSGEGEVLSPDQMLITTSIQKGKIYFGDSRKRSTAKIERINADISAESLAGPFMLEGSFAVNNNKFAFDADISATDKTGEGDSTWNFVGDGFKVTFTGDLVGVKGTTENTLSGKVNASSDDFDYVIAKYFHQKNVTRPEEDKDEQKATKPFLAEGTLTYSNKLFRIEGFSITSDYISGRGDIKVSTAQDIPEVDTSLIFDNIDVDKFIHNPLLEEQKNAPVGNEAITAESFIVQAEQTEDLYEKVSRVIGGVAKEFNMISDISIKNLLYNGQPVEKIVFNADVFNGDLVINECTATLPGNSFLEILGTIKHNAIRPRFSGEFSLSGDSLRNFTGWLGYAVDSAPENVLGEYKLNGDLVLLPQKINLSSLDLSVDKTRANGSVIIRYGDRSPKITSNLQISHLDLDAYNLSEPLANLVKTYYQGDPNNIKTKNFNWLRSLDGHFGGELALDDFVFNKVTYNEISSLFTVNPGVLRIEKLDVESNLVSLSTALLFDITSIRPKIDLQVNANKIDTAAFSDTAAPAPQATNAAAAPATAANTPKIRWPDDPLYFFGMDQFDGKLSINAKSFVHKKLELANMEFAAKLYEGTLTIDKLTGDYANGKLNARGIIGIEDTPNIAISFALNSIEIKQLLTAFTDIDSIEGYSSFSGSVVTFGRTYAEWVKNAKSSIAAVGRSIKVSNFGLHDLIEKSEDVTTARQVDEIAAMAAKTGSTLFETIELQFQTSNGLLDFGEMQLATSRTRGVLSGRIDLVNWLMNMIGQFAYIAQSNEATVNLVFNAKGAVDAPEKSFDLKELYKNKGIAVAPGKQ